MYNPQGDVIGLFDDELNVVVEYTYDSWGKILSITGPLQYSLGRTNPFRYRGYYYDEESGMYYLNSRYYHPEIGRFINADGYVQTGQGILDKNMFAYCANNPTIFCDPSGCSYTITMLAVGDGPVTVTTSIGISYNYDAPKVGNTYYFDAKDFQQAVYDNATEKVKPIIQATAESWCDDIAKGFMDAIGNKNLTYIIPYGHELTALTNIKGYGLASLASTASQLCWDIEQYGTNPRDVVIASAITIASTVGTIALSSVVITYCAPVVAAAGTIFVGVAMSTISDGVKKSILG